MGIARLNGKQIANGILRDNHIASDAAIAESKLSINWNNHTEILQDKKVIFKVQINDQSVGGQNKLNVNSLVTGSAVTSSGTAEGIVTDSPKNKVLVRDGATQDSPFKDAEGNVVYGRMVVEGGDFVVKFYTDADGEETAYTMPAGKTVDLVYYKRGNLLNVPEDYAISDGGSFVEGATDVIAEFNLKQLAADLGITLGNDGNMSLSRSVIEEILVQTRGVTNTTVRASAVIDEVVAARNGKVSLSAELTQIRSDISDEASARSAADQAIRNDLSSIANNKGASLVGIQDSAGNYSANTVEGALAEIGSTLDDLANGIGSATQDEVTTARTSDITGSHDNLDARIEAAEARYEDVKDEVETARNGKASLDAELSSIRTSVSSEATARQSADSTLDGKITTEKNRAELAESNLQTNINNEATARQSADQTLQSNISSEASARQTADTTLQGNIDSEASARQSADQTLQTNINNEASARQSADNTLQTNINNEASARQSGDQAIVSDLASTSANKGASTVGVEAGSGLNGSNVQSVLEDLEGRLAAQESGGGAEVTATHSRDTATTNGVFATDSFDDLEGRLEDIESTVDTEVKALEDAIQDAKDDLASNASGKGASLIGIQDLANVLSSSNVEAALKELYDKIVAEQTARTNADNAIDTRLDALEAEKPKIHVHDRYVFQAVGGETSVSLPNSKKADANTLVVTINGLENAVGINYTETTDANGYVTGVSFSPDALVANDVVILKWLNVVG